MRYEKLNFDINFRFIIIVLFALKFFSVLFATEIFSKFSPLVDAGIYMGGGAPVGAPIRTEIISFFASSFNGVFGSFSAHFIFSLFSILGISYYYALGGRAWFAVFCFCLPSTFVWTSIVGKEAIFSGAFSLLLVLWLRFILSYLRRLEWGVCVAALFVCILFRPHYALAVVWLFLSAAVLKSNLKFKYVTLLMLWLAIGWAIYLLVWDEILLRGFSGIDATGRASRFEYLGIEPATGAGLKIFKNVLPENAIWSIVGPMPGEIVRRPEFIPFFVEGFLVVLFPFIAFLFGKKIGAFNFRPFGDFYCVCLLPALLYLFIIHSPFGILNPGSAVRWRTNFESAFVLLPCLLIFEFYRNRK